MSDNKKIITVCKDCYEGEFHFLIERTFGFCPKCNQFKELAIIKK